MTRPLKGLTSQHHTFNPQQLSLDFIDAVGSTPTFSYHKSKTVSTLALFPKTPAPSKGGVASMFNSNVATSQMRNNWAGEIGYQFVPKVDLPLSALGRAVTGEKALKANATVNVWSVATKKKVASMQVGPADAVSPDGYAYRTLPALVVLQAGQQYYITQTCLVNMPDMWTNSADNAPQANVQVAMLGDSIYSPQGQPNHFPTMTGNIPQQFAGIVTFKATTQPNPHPKPASACICSVPAAPFGRGTGTIKYAAALLSALLSASCSLRI